MRRAPRLCAALAAVCCLAALRCGREVAEDVQSEAVVPVTTAPAQVGTIRGTVHATGVVSPAPGAELLVIAPEAGRIAEMPKAEGDVVRRGDLLVRFEIPTISTDVQSKRAEVTRARARLENAQAAQARAHDLFERGIAARKEVEDADREIADARADLAQAEAALAASETLNGRTTIRASFDGVIARRSHNPGDLVEPTASDPVLRVIDPRRLEVNASVPLPDVPRIVVGAPARVIDNSPPTPVTLKVASRPAAVEPGTAAAPIRLAFTGPANYAVGTPVQVSIDAEVHRDVLLIPVPAVVHEGADTYVFVASGGKAQRRSIVTGLADEQHVEVVSGLKRDEPVITHGHAGLPDGAAISVAPADK
jgi:membrane fusion protein, multidrug efflux system